MLYIGIFAVIVVACVFFFSYDDEKAKGNGQKI